MKYIRDILFGVIIIKVKVNIKQVMLGTAALAGMLVTSQAVANADSMTIKAGDTVWAYAQKYHVSVDKIAEANGLSNPNLIIAGKTINIPGVKTGEKVTTKTTTASASSAKSTSAATSTSSQATSAAATSSSTTSASITSQAVSSSSVAAQSSSTSTASASSVTSSASTSSVASQASSSAVTSSATSQSSASQSSASQASQSSTSVASSTSTTATSTQSAATSTSSQASSTASNTTSSSTTTATATAYSASESTSTSTTSSTASYSSVIAAAKTFIGTPYEQMDCSAFTQAAFAKVGRSIGRTTYAQVTIGTHVSFSQAQAGDLIFWGSDSAPYHVGIYLGGGQYIASPTYGETVSIKSTAYYTPSFAIHM
ncbi:LysM peptidoglycan-binding domain-containing protein [Lactiplantibacillus plantarum]|nr:gamma-D-glutamyl-meso-diaminopimelate peptidase [Lactiplantibacillus plantarum]MCG0783363.1 gamma-D-glutamyl-meso-diaminopimelate peptidase [Lactiplantibacillus plantarum]MCG0810818.1 gamma-D-glutamyl-meso-diaminopimelate peptidase [Lactiplantibacillus plantarum]TXJ67416.1 LysM peptidoglycan-binding domain-containing protein [Lactiplantibacillus plantarum]TXJ70627.1 LysM peptidoglycan-binding domain-containing protein [Lactiplantibacillus plantarum]